MPIFNLHEGSLQHRFLESKAKVQIYGGGFANGKTSGACIKALELAKEYPGSNGLIARSTYPKLNDTIRKEFLKWCPPDWIKSFPMSVNGSNTCTIINGTTINFRYIQQQGRMTQESTTSNLLSATYDWIVVDQIEDPEIGHKDFLDLLGRLRGMAPYRGSDPEMPSSGPRWFIITCNPTRNWVYQKLVKPVHDLSRGVVDPDLMCETDDNGKIVVGEDGLPRSMIELFEGSTYENEMNLEGDYIRTLEAAYKGQMKDRFLLGKWMAYEGLVYPSFDEEVHVIDHSIVYSYYRQLLASASFLQFIEGYDYGLAVPACYICGFVDHSGNVICLDGFYEAETLVDGDDGHINRIKTIRAKYGVHDDNMIYADPQIFKRSSGDSTVKGLRTSEMLREEGIQCIRGNNNIENGILKVSQYLAIMKNHQNPFFGTFGAPRIYFSNKLSFVVDEFNDYYWAKDTSGERTEKPVDRKDHAMDTLKYMLTDRPEITKLVKPVRSEPVGWRRWGEADLPEKPSPRHR